MNIFNVFLKFNAIWSRSQFLADGISLFAKSDRLMPCICRQCLCKHEMLLTSFQHIWQVCIPTVKWKSLKCLSALDLVANSLMHLRHFHLPLEPTGAIPSRMGTVFEYPKRASNGTLYILIQFLFTIFWNELQFIFLTLLCFMLKRLAWCLFSY